MKNIKLISLVSVGISLVGVAAAFAASPQQPDTSDPMAGVTLYAENCASCHGAELEGQPNWRGLNDDGTRPAPPHDETGHTWHHGDGLLFDYTKLGGQDALEQRGIDGFASGMPGFNEVLSDEQIWVILAFIKSTWPERAQEIQAAQTEAEQRERK
jgi:mono/diheme cytochrome c family protein